MYKVFFNDRKIIISEEPEIILNKSTRTEKNLLTTSDIKTWFSQFVVDENHDVFLTNDSPYEFWENVFVPSFTFIKAAGGVVVRNNKILLIFRNDRWDLPKGKIDKGESIEEAAIREVVEECGITGHFITKKLPSTFHIYKSPYEKSKGKWILKETFWFEMKYKGVENGMPQLEENITEIKWFERNELDSVLADTYENLKQIILLYRD